MAGRSTKRAKSSLKEGAKVRVREEFAARYGKRLDATTTGVVVELGTIGIAVLVRFGRGPAKFERWIDEKHLEVTK
jgi:hypothetical protein